MKINLYEKSPGEQAATVLVCIAVLLCIVFLFFVNRGVSGSSRFECQPILSLRVVATDGWSVVLLALALGFERKLLFLCC